MKKIISRDSSLSETAITGASRQNFVMPRREMTKHLLSLQEKKRDCLIGGVHPKKLKTISINSASYY